MPAAIDAWGWRSAVWEQTSSIQLRAIPWSTWAMAQTSSPNSQRTIGVKGAELHAQDQEEVAKQGGLRGVLSVFPGLNRRTSRN
jgi:hypothetical protein